MVRRLIFLLGANTMRQPLVRHPLVLTATTLAIFNASLTDDIDDSMYPELATMCVNRWLVRFGSKFNEYRYAVVKPIEGDNLSIIFQADTMNKLEILATQFNV